MSPDPSSLRAALRDGTRDLHDRTEAAFVLGAPGVTRAEYVAVLGRLLGLYASAEAALAPWASALAGYGLELAPRRKTPLLRRDFRALGGAPIGGAPVGRGPGAGGPVVGIPTVAHAFGTLYVLEGSTLGGQLLRRRLAPALGLTPEAGLAFFSVYGADVGPMWRAFGEALDRFDTAAAPADRAAARGDALAGARAAFLAFERWVVAPTARPALAVPA
ncbi:heme oxygenase [Gemmatimonadetes bacterium T265]|nr:heme oxygenase [Gemmatimonadetes bacterium T265]